MSTRGELETRARQRAEAKYGFYVHLAVYVVINLMLLGINLATSSGTWWSVWPLMGWGIAVAFHALNVFVFGGHNGIVDRMTERELRRHDAAPH